MMCVRDWYLALVGKARKVFTLYLYCSLYNIVAVSYVILFKGCSFIVHDIIQSFDGFW